MSFSAEIYGLTVRQPWATLLTRPVRYTRTGRPVFAKKFETRSWSTEYRGPLMIHAAALPLRDSLRQIRDPRSLRVIGEALIPILYPDPDTRPALGWEDIILDLMQYDRGALPRKAVLGRCRLQAVHLITPELAARVTERERALGDWTPGRYAWELRDMQPLPPQTRNGGQGLWRF